jgi:hypothetical protein
MGTSDDLKTLLEKLSAKIDDMTVSARQIGPARARRGSIGVAAGEGGVTTIHGVRKLGAGPDAEPRTHPLQGKESATEDSTVGTNFP